MKIEDIALEAERLVASIRTAKVVSAQEADMGKLLTLADSHAFVRVPGVGGARLGAKKAHLFEVLRSIEVAEAKVAGGNPALGQHIRSLKSEAAFLTRSIREEEDRILSELEG